MIEVLTAAAALLLGVSGVGKLRHPGPAAAMVLRLLRRPARERRAVVAMVRVVGLGELTIGLTVLGTGSRTAAALLAAAYLGFAVVAVLLLRTGGARTSCGCFGSADSPLGPAHLVLDLVALGTGLAAVAWPPGPGCGLFDGSGIVAVTSSAQALLLAALAYLAVTALPALLAARRLLVASPALQETQ